MTSPVRRSVTKTKATPEKRPPKRMPIGRETMEKRPPKRVIVRSKG